MSWRQIAIDALLAVAVVGTWLGCLGFVQLRRATDRLHTVAFVNVVGLAPVAAMAFVADGTANRAWKVLLILIVSLLTGGALAHAIGRALVLRGEGDAP